MYLFILYTPVGYNSPLFICVLLYPPFFKMRKFCFTVAYSNGLELVNIIFYSKQLLSHSNVLPKFVFCCFPP